MKARSLPPPQAVRDPQDHLDLAIAEGPAALDAASPWLDSGYTGFA